MRPLRRTTGSREEHEAIAARLLARTAPTPPQPDMRRRVRARLESPAARPFRLPGWALSPAVVLAVLMLATAAASATLGRGLMDRLGLLPPARPAPAPSVFPSTPTRSPSAHHDEAAPLLAAPSPPSLPPPPVEAPPVVEPRTAPPAAPVAPVGPLRPLPSSSTATPGTAASRPQATRETAAVAPPVPAPSAAPTPPPPPAVPPVAAARATGVEDDDVPSPTRVGLPATTETRAHGPDDGLLTEAFHALQDSHDPRRALTLAERYRIERPSGLDEEALLIAFTACAQLSEPCGPRYADEYLARYPEGRFAKAARRVLRARSK